MEYTPPETLVVPPLTEHTATVIFVHGLGDTGNGWRPVADMFRADPALPHVKWVLPHSPQIPVTANMGVKMPSWFNIYSFGFKADEDEKGMLRTVAQLTHVIETEIHAGIPPSRIVLGGFSQGGSMALLTGLTGRHALAGVAVLSGWLTMKNKFKGMAAEHAQTTPIFWGHGKEDQLVKQQFSIDSTDFLKNQLGIASAPPGATGKPEGLEYHVYEGLLHATNQRELDDLRAWLKRTIPMQDVDD